MTLYSFPKVMPATTVVVTILPPTYLVIQTKYTVTCYWLLAENVPFVQKPQIQQLIETDDQTSAILLQVRINHRRGGKRQTLSEPICNWISMEMVEPIQSCQFSFKRKQIAIEKPSFRFEGKLSKLKFDKNEIEHKFHALRTSST